MPRAMFWNPLTSAYEELAIAGPKGEDYTSKWAYFRDEKASGTQGGTSVGGTWTKRTLNTVAANTIPGCTLTSDVISLPAGIYYVQARVQQRSPNLAKMRLRNTTDGVTLLVGMSQYGSGTDSNLLCSAAGKFTISGTKNIELQYYSAAVTTYGLGVAVSSGEVEVYAEIEIFKVAA